jgi:predicted nucleic acid-binding protein
MYEVYPPPKIFLNEDGCYRPLCPVDDEFVAGEAVNRWFHREQSRRLKNLHESEMLTFDAELAELLFRMKQRLSRLGRNGGWSLWLRQHNIQRSTADRLVAQYAESYGLTDELRHREIAEPLEANVCLAANRTSKRLKNMLKTPRSRLTFMKVLGDLFGLGIEFGQDDSVRLTMPPAVDAASINYAVPSPVWVDDDGTIKPVDYELKYAEAEADCPV